MNVIQNTLLKVIGSALFEKQTPTIVANQIALIVKESESQAVFPLLYSILDSQFHEVLNAEQYTKYNDSFFRYAIAGTQNFSEHGELHELMTENNIPYVIMKGLASAMYYPEPSLRSMGDVDFLVKSEDLKKANKVIINAGFTVDHGEEKGSKHIVYHRPPMSIWEMHRNVNGIPFGEVGAKIQVEIDKMIKLAETITVDGVTCRVPDKFHHGLIMLLHTASHLTSEGVGLRHLCDWVLFASSLSDSEFRELFEKKLKSFGLWQFAQVLTLLGTRYLGAPKRVWAIEAIERKKVDNDILEGLMDDILNGGNFGTKDENRYREIKYISDRGKGTVGTSNFICQGFKTMNEKVRNDFETIGKYRILYPIGYFKEGGKYIGLLITGKRKTSGTKRMLKEAAERKKIYSKLRLFDNT